MRWVERVSGTLAGLLAIVAGWLAFQLPAVETFGSVSCGNGCYTSSAVYGPGIAPAAHSAIMPPVAIIIVAALALAAFALLDARRSARSRMLAALALVATLVCAVGAGVLLAGNISVSYATLPPSPSMLILQYNVGALFMPSLLAAIVCVITMIWPRHHAQAVAAPVAG
jgi:hypothetical protein